MPVPQAFFSSGLLEKSTAKVYHFSVGCFLARKMLGFLMAFVSV